MPEIRTIECPCCGEYVQCLPDCTLRDDWPAEYETLEADRMWGRLLASAQRLDAQLRYERPDARVVEEFRSALREVLVYWSDDE